MIRVRVRGARAAGCALLIAVSGAVSPARAADLPRLRVCAAASLTDVVEAVAPRFPDGRLDASFGGSGALARQIRDGAPADVFLSASPDWIDYLRDAHALAGEPVVFAHNRLVCIAPLGSPLAAGSGAPQDSAAGRLAGPAELLRRLGADARVAIADPGVPAGEYARAALKHLNLLDAYEPRLVGQKDVRAVLHAVEQGELEAGFVYATDAAVAKVTVLFTFDPSTHPPIAYEAAVLRDAKKPETARRFLEFLQGKEARAALAAAGFTVP